MKNKRHFRVSFVFLYDWQKYCILYLLVLTTISSERKRGAIVVEIVTILLYIHVYGQQLPFAS